MAMYKNTPHFFPPVIVLGGYWCIHKKSHCDPGSSKYFSHFTNLTNL